MLPRKTIRNLRSANCRKCIQIVNPTTTTLVLYHFKSFTIPSGGPFWPLWGEVRAHPAHPPGPTYGPAYVTTKVTRKYGRVVIKSLTRKKDRSTLNWSRQDSGQFYENLVTPVFENKISMPSFNVAI